MLVAYSSFILTLRRGLRLAHRVRCNQISSRPFVSVIVAVRNEYRHVAACLQALLNQDYPERHFEIIVVDDFSTDCTPKHLAGFAKNQTIRILQNSSQKKFQSSKKCALELGILHAKGDILLFTDADCLPPMSWITGLVQLFDPTTGLVAGFSPQQSEKKWLNSILHMDAAAAAVVSAATIGFGRGLTGAGRHLAYRKQAYFDVGGFAALPDSLSGDDDFMLQAVSRHPAWQVKYNLHTDAVVPSTGPDTLRHFLQQKQRHISAGQYYPFTAQLGFALFHFFNVVMWLFFLGGLFLTPCLLIPFALKLFLDYFLLSKFLTLFKLKIDLKMFPFWEALFLYYNTILGPIGFIKKIKWSK